MIMASRMALDQEGFFMVSPSFVSPNSLPGGCVLQHGPNLGRAGGCSLRTAAPTSAGSSRRAHWCSGVAGHDIDDQVDRFAAVAIGDLRVGAFLKKVVDEIRSACLHDHV